MSGPPVVSFKMLRSKAGWPVIAIVSVVNMSKRNLCGKRHSTQAVKVDLFLQKEVVHFPRPFIWRPLYPRDNGTKNLSRGEGDLY